MDVVDRALPPDTRLRPAWPYLAALLVAIDEPALRRWDDGLRRQLEAAITAGAPRTVMLTLTLFWPEVGG